MEESDNRSELLNGEEAIKVHNSEVVSGTPSEAAAQTDAAEKIGSGVTAIVKKSLTIYNRVKLFVKSQSKKNLIIAGGAALALIITGAVIYELSLSGARHEAQQLYIINENPAAAYNKVKGYKFSFVDNEKFKSEKRLYLLSVGAKSAKSAKSAAPKTTAKPLISIQGLTLDNSSKSYTKANGTAYNAGTLKATFIKVKISFKDAAGKVIDTDWTYAVGSEGLNPGESKKFTCSVKKDTKIRSVSYEIVD